MQQLADYGAFHDEEQGYVDVEQLIAGETLDSASEPSPLVVRQPRRRSASWAAIAAAVVTILLIGVIPLLVANQETPPADTIAPGTWSRVPHDEAVFGGEGSQMMVSVTAGGPGLVAVGGGGLHDSGHAAVWTSVDGASWSRVLHDEALFGGAGAQTMTSVTAGGPGLVAVGWNLETPWDADAVVWTSADGITWSRVPPDEETFGGSSYQAMWAVTAGGPGLVAVGEDRSRDVDDGDLAVWTSVDGITWARVPHDEEVFGTGQFTSVTSDSGLIVAVGNEGSDDGDDAAVWTSADGIVWSRVPHDEDVFDRAGMQAVTAGGPGFVAVGWSEAAAVVWTSVDGITWSRVPHDEAVFGEATGMQSVIVGGPGLVAVGWDQSGQPNRAAVWTSRDGINWSRVPHDDNIFGGREADEQGMESVTIGGPGLVAVGSAEGSAGVWLMPLDD